MPSTVLAGSPAWTTPPRFGFIEQDQLQRYADKAYGGDIDKARQDWNVAFFENHEDDGSLIGFSIDQESVELNAFLAKEKRILADMADLLGKPDEGIRYREGASQLAGYINSCLFDETSGFSTIARLPRAMWQMPTAASASC